MATHDYIISNASGAAVRADLNNALAAIATNNSSATEPTTTYAYQWWADTGSSPTVMKLRNAANSGWVTLFQLDGEWSLIPFENGTAAAPSIYFKDSGTDTGFYSPGVDQVGITTGGAVRLTTSTTAFTGTLPWQGQNGTAAAPALSFSGDPNSGVYNVGADDVGISTNGTLRFDVSTTATTSTLPVVHPLGAVGTPSVTFTGDLNTGIWSPAADTIAVSTNGAERSRVDSSGRLLVGTTSTSAGVRSVFQATPSNPNSNVNFLLSSGNSGPNSGDGLGYLIFSDATHTFSAQIGAVRDGGTWSSTSKPTRLEFSTTADGASTPTERMRIASTGLVATISSTGADSFYSNSTEGAGTTYNLFRGGHSATSTTSSTACIRIYTNGNVQNTNGSYTTLSDAKLKENIVDAGSQWDDLKAIQIRNWNFKAETGHETHRQIGPIAQELETVCPGLVFETPDRDEDGNETGTVTKGVNQSVLYMKAVKALQEAMERIETLEAKVAALEAN